MSPIDLVIDRLSAHRVRPNGRDRWRACCPAHHGNNPSALSVGIGAEGQVLLRCWCGCDVDAVAGAMGLELGDLFPPRESGAGKSARRRLITASQALEVLADEATFIVVCASDMAGGKALDAVTRERLLRAAARVTLICDEVRA